PIPLRETATDASSSPSRSCLPAPSRTAFGPGHCGQAKFALGYAPVDRQRQWSGNHQALGTTLRRRTPEGADPAQPQGRSHLPQDEAAGQQRPHRWISLPLPAEDQIPACRARLAYHEWRSAGASPQEAKQAVAAAVLTVRPSDPGIRILVDEHPEA